MTNMHGRSLVLDWVSQGTAVSGTADRTADQKLSLSLQIVLALAGSLLVAALAQIKIPVPFSPIPITGQTFGVLFVGAALGARLSILSMIFYLVQGGIGLPFFAGGEAGWQVFQGATAGYLFGFLLAGWIVGKLSEKGMDRKFGSSLLAFGVGHLSVFACGMLWLGMYTGYDQVIAMGFLPFVPGLIVKTLLLAGLLPGIWKLRNSI